MKAPAFWSEPRSTEARLLAPASAVYDLASRLTRAVSSTETADATVICIGNLVAGGAGKTPVALAIAEILKSHEIAFLTRGYGGRESGPLRVDTNSHTASDVGDEALLLAQVAPTWVSRDRPKGADAAAASGATIVIMDDGFQNPSLAKDISFIVIDGATGFGNGRVMPAGPLRETVTRGLTRADAVIIVGDDEARTEDRIGGQIKAFKARLEPNTDHLSGRRVVAFAGIGRPQKFFDTLTKMGCQIVAQHEFADHQPYSPEQIMKLCEEAAALDATPVTTEKDLVRLPPEARAMVESVPVTLVWGDAASISAFLQERLA